MKKSIFIFCIVFLILIMSTSCKSKKGEDDLTSDNDFKTTVSAPKWKNEEEKVVADDWKARVERILQSDNITRVEYMRGVRRPRVFSSEDSALINRWKVLLPKLRCSVVPAAGYIGGSASLIFYEGEVPITLIGNHPRANIILIGESNYNYMIRIDNYKKIKDELASLIFDLGVVIYYPDSMYPD